MLYIKEGKEDAIGVTKLSMEQPNQHDQNNSSGSRIFSELRKRGPPRKYLRPHEEENYVLHNRPRTNQEAIGSRNEALVLPNFETFIRNIQQHPMVQGNVDPSHLSIGHPIFGIVDGEFRDGYLLSVIASNCDTTLRGLAFKPGHFLPITPEDEVSLRIQSSNLKVGQLVFGLVDGEDHNGYLVSLRSMNCSIVLRGTASKPGRVLPVTPENDAILGIPFVNKDWMPSLIETHTHVQNPFPMTRKHNGNNM